MVTKKLKEAVIKYYQQNPDTQLKAREIAEKFGIYVGEGEKTAKFIRDLKRTALGTRSKKWSKEVKGKLKDLLNEIQSFKENFDKGTLESTITTSFEPKTIDDLYAEHKVNPELYTIKNYWSKK